MTDTVSKILRCNAAGCKVAQTGNCMDGVIPAIACRNVFGQEEPAVGSTISGAHLAEDTPADDEDELEVFDPDRHVQLASGSALDVSAAQSILEARGATVVAFIGFKGSGKTSLFSSIYNLLQSAPLSSKLSFAGSETIVDFEIRCHDTRLASKQLVPKTARTERSSALAYLHLRLADDSAGGTVRDLLFADRSGEFFKDAINDTQLCDEIKELHRADAIALLVDGEDLADNQKRHGALANALSLIQVLVDQQKLSATHNLDVIVSKADALASAPESESKSAKAARQHFERSISDRFGAQIGSIEFWEVAACPKSGTLGTGHGVPPLVRRWVVRKKPNQIEVVASPLSKNLSEFDRFNERYFRRQPTGDVNV